MASEDSTAGGGDNDPNAVVRQAVGAEENIRGSQARKAPGVAAAQVMWKVSSGGSAAGWYM